MRMAAPNERKHLTWFRAHPKALSITGSLIVLGTFCVKEVWKQSIESEVKVVQEKMTSLQTEAGIDEAHASVLKPAGERMLAAQPPPFARNDMYQIDRSMDEQLSLDEKGIAHTHELFSTTGKKDSVYYDELTKVLKQTKKDLALLSRICGVILVLGVVPGCDKGRFP
jgi:hypothetical protein